MKPMFISNTKLSYEQFTFYYGFKHLSVGDISMGLSDQDTPYPTKALKSALAMFL